MVLFGQANKLKCSECGYVVSYSDVPPKKCPKCGASLAESQDPDKLKSLNLKSKKSPKKAIKKIKKSQKKNKNTSSSLAEVLKDHNVCNSSRNTKKHLLSRKEREKRKSMISSITSTSPFSKKKGEKKTKSKLETMEPPDLKKIIKNDVKKSSRKEEVKNLISNTDNSVSNSKKKGNLLAKKKSPAAKEMKISKSKIKVKGVKVKSNSSTNLDFDQYAICLNEKTDREYLKFMGAVTKERQELFASNPRFKYFLELGANLDFIATSILEGELDRMSLKSPETGLDEFCFFLSSNDIIYIVYGNFPDKKANWLLNHMKNDMEGLLKDKDPKNLDKMERFNLEKDFKKKSKYILREYIKLQKVFSDNKIVSLEDYLRIDYFGLSYESVGVISSLITEGELEIKGLPPMDPNMENYEEEMQELRESLITAKIEAIAANTMANTQMMPYWITVKLGFQHYRYLIFSEINNYYLYLLAEGNLAYKDSLITHLKEYLTKETKEPFHGDLRRFKETNHQIKEFLITNNQNIE